MKVVKTVQRIINLCSNEEDKKIMVNIEGSIEGLI